MRESHLPLSKKKYLLIVLLLSCSFFSQLVSAEGGTGGNKDEPLSLVTSSITNGETNISIKPTIKLTFNKNIVNMSVSENNKTYFTIQKADGQTIPIDVVLADDQIEFEKRNDAVLIAKADLENGTNYSIVISPLLKSKSGISLGNEIRISFTTEGTKQIDNTQTSVPTPITSNLGTKTQTTNNTSNQAVNQLSQSTNGQTTNAQTTNNTQKETTNVEKQPDGETTDKVQEENVEKPKNIKPYEKAIKTNSEKGTKSDNNFLTTSMIIGFIVIILGVSVFFYFRKKLK